MRIILILFFLATITSTTYAQADSRISTMDFVQVLNDHQQEAMYYYQNNWKVLRDSAISKNYIHSYQLLETPFSEDAPFHIILITTYQDQQQFEHREDRFGELIDQRGGLRLMNDKEPGEFRQIVFNKEQVKHWNE